MRLTLAIPLALLILSLASKAAAASDSAEEPDGEETVEEIEEVDDDDDDNDDGESSSCPRKSRTVEKLLGGKRVVQEQVQILTKAGCIWVLSGGSAKQFVNAQNCASCRAVGSGFACNGGGTAFHPGCRLVRGPDCRFYAVGARPELPCINQRNLCPPLKQRVAKILGGKFVSQTLVQLQTRMGCKWVLQGGNAMRFTLASNCATCFVRGTGIGCTGPGLALHPFCPLERGPDCQLYPVGAKPYLPCSRSAVPNRLQLSACPPKMKTETRILGGKRVSQVQIQLQTRMGCIWVLPGGNTQRFTVARNCANCWVTGHGFSCSGPGLARHPSCRLERGPDCKFHLVGDRPELPCSPKIRVSACPPQIKTVTAVLGGKSISQTLVQIQTKMGCIWVLRGGNSQQFRVASNCASCRVSGAGIGCTGPGLARHRRCRLMRGPDCNLYPVGAKPELPCK